MVMTRAIKKRMQSALVGNGLCELGDILDLILEHLPVHDGIRLLKTSTGLYYNNEIGATWIIYKALCSSKCFNRRIRRKGTSAEYESHNLRFHEWQDCFSAVVCHEEQNWFEEHGGDGRWVKNFSYKKHTDGEIEDNPIVKRAVVVHFKLYLSTPSSHDGLINANMEDLVYRDPSAF